MDKFFLHCATRLLTLRPPWLRPPQTGPELTIHGQLNIGLQEKNIDEKHDLNWQETFGYGIDQLTQSEAGHLRRATSVDEIRDRLAKARHERIQRLGKKGIETPRSKRSKSAKQTEVDSPLDMHKSAGSETSVAGISPNASEHRGPGPTHVRPDTALHQLPPH